MKNREKKIYFSIFVVTALISLIFGAISGYSRVFVEKKADMLIDEAINMVESKGMDTLSPADMDKIAEDYKAAYILVRKPQIFASYKNFDQQGYAIKKILQQYDQIVSGNGKFEADSFIYVNYLLNRRKAGSYLGLYTAVVFLAMAVFSGLATVLTGRGKA